MITFRQLCAAAFVAMAGTATAGTATAGAQQPADSAAAIPAIGSVAPDFTFRPITAKGISQRPARLSDYRGQTVVLWFFVKARTRG